MIKLNFGEILNELLIEKDMKINVFAEKTNIDLSLVYKYLRNECKPSLMNAIKIAEFFNCSMDFLFGLTETYENKDYKFNKDFSTQFQKLLSETKTTRYRLEKDLKINHQRLDEWFYGKSLPSMDSIITLARYFDCGIDWLITNKIR